MTLPFSPQITVLGKRHNRGAFSCGKVQLDTYLQTKASQDLKRWLAAVFILHARGSDDIIGYFALSGLSIDPGALPKDISKKLPPKRPVPCTLLAQFAVATKWQGKGVSRWMLSAVFDKVWTNAQTQGSFALVVDAVDDDAIQYWAHNDFIQFPSTPNRLFMPMATIGKLFQ